MTIVAGILYSERVGRRGGHVQQRATPNRHNFCPDGTNTEGDNDIVDRIAKFDISEYYWKFPMVCSADFGLSLGEFALVE
jgi:hypothetical protein